MQRMDHEATRITGDPRRSGQVTRYHTWPRLKDQSVAEHSWQVARILMAIWPGVSKDVLVHAIIHDVGEVSTGDLPFPTKQRNPDLKKIMDKAEYNAHLAMCLPWGLPKPRLLVSPEKEIFKLADYIEMWEWALDELSFGNSSAAIVRERCASEISLLTAAISKHDPDIAERARRYMRRRKKCKGEE